MQEQALLSAGHCENPGPERVSLAREVQTMLPLVVVVVVGGGGQTMHSGGSGSGGGGVIPCILV